MSLEELIQKFEEKLSKNLNENHWQKFISDNPFILRLAFGYPISVFGEQVSVGGGKFNNTGGKLADYVLKLGLYGNISIVEIKKPGSRLLENTAYRGGVYAPSKDLSGSVTQVLDQKFWLHQEINQKKVRESINDLFAYAVQCIVIIGKSLEDQDRSKSFELYRNNLRDVFVITFDELLDKLRALHEFLKTGNQQDTIMPRLLGDEEDRDVEYDYDEFEDLEADET